MVRVVDLSIGLTPELIFMVRVVDLSIELTPELIFMVRVVDLSIGLTPGAVVSGVGTTSVPVIDTPSPMTVRSTTKQRDANF